MTPAAKAPIKRALGTAIDFIMLSALAALISVAVYTPSGGHVRSSSPTWTVQTCKQQGDVSNCQLAIFGWEVDRVRLATAPQVRTYHAVPRSGGGGGTALVNATTATPIDQSGQPVSAFYVDWIEGAAAIIVFAALQSLFGGTFGDRLAGVAIASPDGGRPRFVSALTRNALVWGWWLVLGVAASRPPPILPDAPRGPEVGFLTYALATLWIAAVVTADVVMEISPIDEISRTKTVLRPTRVSPRR